MCSDLAGQHILLIAEYISSGGTRTYAEQLINFYARHGALVTFVSFWETDGDDRLQDLARNHGFSCTTYPKVMANFGVTAKTSVWSYPRMLAERNAFSDFVSTEAADRVVVSVGTPGLLAGACGAAPRPLYILHTYPHGIRQRLFGRHYMSRFFPPDVRVLAVSNFERDVILDRWRLVGPGQDVRTLHSTTGPEQPTVQRVPRGPVAVVTAAGLVDYKLPMMWVDVAKTVLDCVPEDSVQFTWLGEGPLLREAQHAAQASGHGKNIRFLGLQERVEPFYAAADIYFQLSAIETLGLSVIDAQRFGLPSVVTNVGGLPEVVEHGVTGMLVSPFDPHEAVDAMLVLVSSPELRMSMSRAAQRNYATRFAPARWDVGMLEAHQ